MNLLLPEL